MRTRTTAFTVTFTAGYCTQDHTHSSYTDTKPSFPACQPSKSRGDTQSLALSQRTKRQKKTSTYTESAASAQYVQVDGRGLGQALEHAVDLLDVEPHVGLPLPAAQHQVVHLLGTGARPLQHTALRDALDHLRGATKTVSVT